MRFAVIVRTSGVSSGGSNFGNDGVGMRGIVCSVQTRGYEEPAIPTLAYFGKRRANRSVVFRRRESDIMLMEIDAEVLELPSLPFECCSVQMPSTTFQKTIKDIAVLGDTCTITIHPEIDFDFEAAGEIYSEPNENPLRFVRETHFPRSARPASTIQKARFQRFTAPRIQSAIGKRGAVNR